MSLDEELQRKLNYIREISELLSASPVIPVGPAWDARSQVEWAIAELQRLKAKEMKSVWMIFYERSGEGCWASYQEAIDYFNKVNKKNYTKADFDGGFNGQGYPALEEMQIVSDDKEPLYFER